MFTHKRVDAWDSLGRALVEAGFEITATWSVHTESEHSLHRAKKNAAASTILLVCRKRDPSAGSPWWHEIQDEVRRAPVREPRNPKGGILAGGIAFHIAWVGPLMAVGSLGLYLWADPQRNLEEARTIAFYAVAMFQVFHVLAIRVSRESVFTAGFFRNRYLIGAVALTVGLQLAVIFLPALQPIFRTQSLPLQEFALATGIASSVFFAVEAEKAVRRRREERLNVAAIPSPAG